MIQLQDSEKLPSMVTHLQQAFEITIHSYKDEALDFVFCLDLSDCIPVMRDQH
jgi:hypothetical protein